MAEKTKKEEQKRGTDQYLISDGSFSSDGGEIKKVEAFSDEQSNSSDSQDCVVETDTKIKSTGFFHKLRLRDMMKSKGHRRTEVFREGESDEYNSEVDGEDFDDENAINYDILGVREGEHRSHNALVDLIIRYETLPEGWADMLTFKHRKKQHQKRLDEGWHRELEAQGEDAEPIPRPLVDENNITRDILTHDQSFIFSDEMIVYDDRKIVNTEFYIVDQRFYIVFKDSRNIVYTPFDIEEVAAVVMSPSNPMSAAFRMKDQAKF